MCLFNNKRDEVRIRARGVHFLKQSIILPAEQIGRHPTYRVYLVPGTDMVFIGQYIKNN